MLLFLFFYLYNLDYRYLTSYSCLFCSLRSTYEGAEATHLHTIQHYNLGLYSQCNQKIICVFIKVLRYKVIEICTLHYSMFPYSRVELLCFLITEAVAGICTCYSIIHTAGGKKFSSLLKTFPSVNYTTSNLPLLSCKPVSHNSKTAEQ